MHDDRFRGMYEEWNQDLWWVLVEKTTGDALLRVRGVVMGHGIEAYRRLHRWYGEQTDLRLAEFRQRVLRPMQAKKGRIYWQMHRRMAGIDYGTATRGPGLH